MKMSQDIPLFLNLGTVCWLQGRDYKRGLMAQFDHFLTTKVLTTVKDGLIRYNNTKTSSNGVNSMWSVKNSTSLLSSLDHWMSIQQHQFRHMTFPPCTHQSHTICFSLELLHLYTTHSRGEMEVTDIPTSKLGVERGIS